MSLFQSRKQIQVGFINILVTVELEGGGQM